MTKKKAVSIGIVAIVALILILSPLNRQFVGSSTGTHGGSTQYGFNSMPSFDLNTGIRSESMKDAASSYMPLPDQPAVDSGRNIIQTASVSMVVSDVEKTSTDIENTVKTKEGFVANRSLNSSQSGKTITNGYLQIRIPQLQLRAFIDELKSLAVRVTNIQTSSDDVTTQVRDLTAEIENLESQEAQLRTLYTRTNNITQILEVERELTRVRTQIDQIKSQLAYYERASALSTVTINLALDEAQLPTTPAERFLPGTVWNNAIRELTTVLQNLAYIGIYLVVFSVIWIPVIVGYVVFRKNRKRNGKN